MKLSTFILQRHLEADIIEYKHPTLEVNSADCCCSHAEDKFRKVITGESDVIPGVYSSRSSGSAPDSLLQSRPTILKVVFYTCRIKFNNYSKLRL